MMQLESRLQAAFDVLSSAAKEAYKDTFLLSNPVLSKNPFTSCFLDAFLGNRKPSKLPVGAVMLNILKYYCKNFLHLMLYISCFVQYALSGLRFNYKKGRELILIDIFVLTDKVRESKKYNDNYFPGLTKVLQKKAMDYVYLPVFYNPKKRLNLLSVFGILKRQKVPLLTEYQLLKAFDLVRICCFIVIYPFRVLKFARNLPKDEFSFDLLRFALLDTIDQVTFYGYTRYLQGKRVAELPYEHIKVISWYENQPIDKNLYRGLRGSSRNVMIYGAQLFLYSETLLNLLPDVNEVPLGLVPDKIVVNGSHFVREQAGLNYIVGPALRYRNLFKDEIKAENRSCILVLLPYFKEDTECILKMLSEANLSSHALLIKFHPTTVQNDFQKYIRSNWTVADEDIYSLFERAMIVIGAASGTLIEAASLSIPVIVVKNNKRFEYNTLPEYGKGIIWERVSNAKEMEEQVYAFESALINRNPDIIKIGSEYKKIFFCEPTEANIIRAFDLDLA